MIVPTAGCPATFSKSVSGSVTRRNAQRNPLPSASKKTNVENPASARRRPTTSKIASCSGRRSASSPASPKARTRLSVGESVAGVAGASLGVIVRRNWVNPASASRSGPKNHHRPTLSAVRAARRLMPDLILMDVEMPVMNGHDACKQLKADPATAEIPVLMMTGFDPRPERSKMVEAGGDDLIVKPIPMRDLQVRVRALLRLKELRRDLRSTQESLRELVKRENPTESKAPFDDSVALTAQA